MEGRSGFGFLGSLIGLDHFEARLFIKLEKIERLIQEVLLDGSQDKAALEAALAGLKATDTVIDNIEPTQGVPQ